MSATDSTDNSTLLDAYNKKTVTANWAGRAVEFDIPITAFSSYQLDRGTLRLLRQLEGREPRYRRALDLGCGYGPIAIYLAVTGYAAAVTGIDRDALSVAFARRNAEKNSLAMDNCTFVGGLAYDDLPDDDKYDAIISNIPAKAGEPVHRAMLGDAAGFLSDEGEVAIVVVEPLEERIDSILAREEIIITSKLKRAGHVVYTYSFRHTLPPIVQPYTRATLSLTWQKYSYDIETAFGLPEFDTRSRVTDLVLKFIAKHKQKLRFDKLIIYNPGQGHLPLLLTCIAGRIQQVTLVSRDALALRQSALNLSKHDCCGTVRQEHTVGFWPEGTADQVDLCVGILNDKEGVDINLEKISHVRLACPQVPIIIGCSMSLGARLEKALRKRGIRASIVKKRQGVCVIQCRPCNDQPACLA